MMENCKSWTWKSSMRIIL